MPLEFVVHHFLHPGGTTAIQRTFIDMPISPGKLCLIRQVRVQIVQLVNQRSFDVFYGMSVDPDHVLASTVLWDSTMFIQASIIISRADFTGEEQLRSPETFLFPEGIECPYGRLPFFIQNSNTSAIVQDWNITVFFEYIKKDARDLAIAVMRRGRGVTRRVP